MPIYEYECSDCGQIEEAVQKISDAPLTECRGCSGSLHKIISQSAFHLKGGGWYADAYSSKPANAAEKSESSTSATSATSGAASAAGASADSKPAEKKASGD